MKKDTFLACLILAVLMLQAKEIVYQYRDEVVHWMKNGGRVVLRKRPIGNKECKLCLSGDKLDIQTVY